MNVLAVIPARGGSKSIPRKNLAEVEGRPLISFVIEAATNAARVDRVVVSTEDDEIARVARDWGAEVPFRRPGALATDDVSIIPVVQHAMQEMDQTGFRSDTVVSLQPTSPFLEGEDLDRAVLKLEETRADSVVSVLPIAHEHPFWVKGLEGDRVVPFNEYTNESYLQRQDLPPAYIYDGGIFARKRSLLEDWSGHDFGLGEDIRAIVLGGWKSVHVDDEHHLELVRVMMKRKGSESD
jgi:N-acylneuraminate cytidylyltransferase/CMP-N,N'-diacetyllegionaminic acid synthase